MACTIKVLVVLHIAVLVSCKSDAEKPQTELDAHLLEIPLSIDNTSIKELSYTLDFTDCAIEMLYEEDPHTFSVSEITGFSLDVLSHQELETLIDKYMSICEFDKQNSSVDDIKRFWSDVKSVESELEYQNEDSTIVWATWSVYGEGRYMLFIAR